MPASSLLLVGVFSLLAGLAVAWMVLRTRHLVERARGEHLSQQLTEAQLRIAQRDVEASEQRARNAEQQATIAELRVQLSEQAHQHQDRLASFEEARARMEESFKALSADALRASQEGFLHLAGATFEKFQAQTEGKLAQREQAVKALVEPIGKSLDGVRSKIDELEKTRAEAYGSLTNQVKSMVVSQDLLRTEAGNLVKALRAPQTRGRWGEMQLKRVVEMAGMLEYCDFEQQVSAAIDEGRLRPDLIVRLPGGKRVVVDAKAPLQAYLDATESTDDTARHDFLMAHARQLRDHLTKLGNKSYWQQFEPSPEFVVMFLPGESFFSAALEKQPGLIEEGVKQSVIVATPTTLIALLRAVSYGWRQESLAENAQAIAKLGRELYERVGKFADHFGKVGRQLTSAVTSYNEAVGTLETRVLPSARRFRDLRAGDGKIAPLEGVQQTARGLHAAELILPSPESDET